MNEKTKRKSCRLLRRVTFIFRSGTIYGETTCSVLPNGENRRHITAAVAVIWRRPYSGKRLVKHIFVAFLHELMGACDERKRVDMIKLLKHIQKEMGSGGTQLDGPLA